MKKLSIVILFVCLTTLLFSQMPRVNPSSLAFHLPLDSAVNNILTQVLLFPQEKIYVQTDKPYYISGEKIFFRAFLLNALSHEPSDISRYVYVELINPEDSIVTRLQIRPENNMFYGALPLPEELPQGDYKLRAYTRLMENIGEEAYFSKYVRIADPQIVTITMETKFDFNAPKQTDIQLRFTDAQTNAPLIAEQISLRLNSDKVINLKPDNEGWVRTKVNLSADDSQRVLWVEFNTEKRVYTQYIRIPYPEGKFDVAFYPEGGNLIAGQASNIAFKALKSNGNAVAIRGEVFDTQNQKITDFTTTHDGMGRFTLNPEFGKQYYATCYQGEQSIQVNLPEVKNNTYALSSVWRQNKLWITVNKPAEKPCPEMYLVAHARGNIVYAGKWNSDNEVISIEKNVFPSGVTHLLLLTKDFQLLSERLVFTIHVDDWLKPVIHTQKERYKPREQVKMNINVLHGIAGQARNDREENDDSPEGNFVISVTDDKDVKVDTTSTILSEILLTSELRGQIANPAYYFQPDNRQAEQAADLLMLTHGWNRYDIPAALRGDFRMPAIPAEQAQSLSGTVKGGLLSKPYKGARVSLFATGLDFFDTRETDENGRFVFEDLEFADSVRYVVEASNKRGKDIVELYLDAVLFPPSTASWILPEASQMKDEEPEFLDYVAKADQKYVYENGMRMINLPELTVRGIDRRNDLLTIPQHRTQTVINKQEIYEMASASIADAIARLPYVRIIGDKVIRQGKVVLDLENAPPLYDIAAVALTPRGGVGWTPKTFNYDEIAPPPTFNKEIVSPLGYQTPVEFYSPRYDTPEAVNNSMPDLRSTIYWKPDVEIDEIGKAAVDFYSADGETNYTVIMEGISKNGIPIRNTKKITVSSKLPDDKNIPDMQENFQNPSPINSQNINWITINTDINIKNMEKKPDSTFQISSKEITNAQYCNFLNEMGIHPDDSSIVWKFGDYNSTWFSCNDHSASFTSGDSKDRPVSYEADYAQIAYIDGQWAPKTIEWANYPMIYVSWLGAKAFCDFYGYRLPSEEEWEYAARLGNQNVNENTYSGKAHRNKIEDVAWYLKNSHLPGNSGLENGAGTHAVGTKSPTLIQLYDMSGNVWEWTATKKEYEQENYYIFRGGSWNDWKENCYVSYSGKGIHTFRDYDVGFRVCKELSCSES